MNGEHQRISKEALTQRGHLSCTCTTTTEQTRQKTEFSRDCRWSEESVFQDAPKNGALPAHDARLGASHFSVLPTSLRLEHSAQPCSDSQYYTMSMLPTRL